MGPNTEHCGTPCCVIIISNIQDIGKVVANRIVFIMGEHGSATNYADKSLLTTCPPPLRSFHSFLKCNSISFVNTTYSQLFLRKLCV